MLDRSAELVAKLCRKYEIPIAWLYAADLKAGKRGITTHDAVSKAFKRGTHWDPGAGFPVERYLKLVRTKLGEKASKAPAKPLKESPPVLRQGSTGWQVKRLQRLLRQHGLFPEPALIDGDFGEITDAAVRAFQDWSDLRAGRDRRAADLAGAAGGGRGGGGRRADAAAARLGPAGGDLTLGENAGSGARAREPAPPSRVRPWEPRRAWC